MRILNTVVVSYRGFRVIAQAIIPGILTADQSSCCQYGSIDDGKTIANNKDFMEIMVQIADKMNLTKDITVKDAQN